MPSDALTEKIVEEAVKRANLWGPQQSLHYPTIMRSGTLNNGHEVHYLFNYTGNPAQVSYPLPSGKDLLTGSPIQRNSTITLPGWGAAIVEETP